SVHLVSPGFRLKQVRRIATRFDKTAKSFTAFLALGPTPGEVRGAALVGGGHSVRDAGRSLELPKVPSASVLKVSYWKSNIGKQSEIGQDRCAPRGCALLDFRWQRHRNPDPESRAAAGTFRSSRIVRRRPAPVPASFRPRTG